MKKALLIAIQYKDTKDMTDSVLQSSHGDILAFRKLLIGENIHVGILL